MTGVVRDDTALVWAVFVPPEAKVYETVGLKAVDVVCTETGAFLTAAATVAVPAEFSGKSCLAAPIFCVCCCCCNT